MSIQAVGWVLDNSRATGNDRLVMISLANHADELRVCWPSVDTICKETLVSRATTFRCLERLRDQGEIERVPESVLTPAQRERFHKIRFDRRPIIYRLAGSQIETASTSGVSPDALRGLTGTTYGISAVRPESSIEPLENRELRKLAKGEIAAIRNRLRHPERVS